MLVKLYKDNPDPRLIDRIVEVLRDGGLIIYPTDSIYAIGCDIFHARAVEQVCRLKGLPVEKANLSFVCRDLSHIAEFARISTPVFKLMKSCLPGPYTFILKSSSLLPKPFRQKKTVGIRVPDNPIVLAIVETLGNPLLSMTLKDDNDEVEYYCEPSLIEERYGARVSLVVDGGPGGYEPTAIIDCTGDAPVQLR